MERPIFPVTKKEAEKQGRTYSSKENREALFPSQLRQLREEKGISQATLANNLGVSKSTIGLYETGDTLPDAKTLHDLAEYFDVSCDWLLGRPGGVKVLNADVQSATSYTGLSESAISFLHSLNGSQTADYLRIISAMLEDKTFRAILPSVVSLEHAKLEMDLERFGIRSVKEGWTNDGYVVNGFDYCDMLEFRLAQQLNLVISHITDPSADD